MPSIQNAVLTIAGFDPSGGAGVLADIKTFEQLGVYGCAVSTCISFQTDLSFDGIQWLEMTAIKSQFDALSKRFDFEYVKIGMIRDSQTLKAVIGMLRVYNPGIKIIWDPVLKTSTGYRIHEDTFSAEIAPLLDFIYLITPNLREAEVLKINLLQSKTNILITSGEPGSSESVDILNLNGNLIKITSPKLENAEKHGSGCVLSAAITAYLSQNMGLEHSCRKAKDYTAGFLSGTPSLLGFHHSINAN